jgi:hypothetical protein
MRHFLLALVAGMTVLAAGTVQAQSSPVVVELYTSQGCSSCPPADDMLRQLASRDDVIPLALHVDYWDYIGWKDTFGSPAHTRRQHGYANAAQARTVYTPQFIVGGMDHVIGAKSMELMDAVQARAVTAGLVAVRAVRQGDTLSIAADPATGTSGQMVVQVVRYIPQAQVQIARGENAGRSITYTNIVNSWNVVGQWNGATPLAISTPVSGGEPIVVIVQDASFGPIYGVARLR